MRRSIYGMARETTLSKKEREKVRRVLVKKRGRASAESSIEKRDRSRERLSGSMMPGCGLMKFSSRVHLLMQAVHESGLLRVAFFRRFEIECENFTCRYCFFAVVMGS